MFENLANDIQQSIVKQIREARLVDIPYSGMFQLPQDFINKAWEGVNHEELQNEISRRLEAELADRIVNHLATEISTDIKQLLSVKERREAIRAVARENLDRITKQA